MPAGGNRTVIIETSDALGLGGPEHVQLHGVDGSSQVWRGSHTLVCRFCGSTDIPAYNVRSRRHRCVSCERANGRLRGTGKRLVPLVPAYQTRRKQPRPLLPGPYPETLLVPLTRGFFAIIDHCDADLVAPYCWHAAVNRPGLVYAERGRLIHEAGKSLIKMEHHLIGKPPPGKVIDHINGETLDNRRANLREATTAENNRNSKKQKQSANPYKGVRASGKRWAAQIFAGGNLRWLGTFDTPEEAHAVYMTAARAQYGEFARAA